MARVFAQPDNRYSSKMRLACALLMLAIGVVVAQVADRAVGSVPSSGSSEQVSLVTLRQPPRASASGCQADSDRVSRAASTVSRVRR